MPTPDSSDNSTSFKSLREYCKQLGISAETCGRSIDQLIGDARKTDDPRAWLAARSNAPPDDDLVDDNPPPPVAIEPRELAAGEQLAAADLPAASPLVEIDMPSPPATIHLVSVPLPIAAEEPVGYLEREMHLDVRLDSAASIAFRKLWAALDRNNMRLASGRHVGKSRADVIRWVFEQLATAIEEQMR